MARRRTKGRRLARIRVGTSGWRYKQWRGRFYPDGLRQKEELEYAADRFDTLEINGSFYGLIPAPTWRSWHDLVPEGFRYAVKGSRFITHNKKLSDVEIPLANFFASGVLELRSKLGPVLWQVPASMRFDGERIEHFFALLPKTTDSAVRLADRHDSRVSEPAYPSSERHRIRHAFEFRHESFMTDAMARIARRHGVAIVFSHSSQWPYVEQVTAGFVYVRLHGPEKLYASRYDDLLGWWSRRLKAWRDASAPSDSANFSSLQSPRRRGRDVYVYFDNDHRAYAPEEAMALRRRLHLD